MSTYIPYDQVGIANFDTTDTFSQVELFNSTEPAITTEDFEVAANTTLLARAVVGLNAAGKLVMASDDVVGGARATNALTLTGVGTANETVTIGSTVYKLVAAPAAAYDVKIGATTAETTANLIAAINGDPAGLATLYGAGTVEHPSVEARLNAAGVIGLVADVPGTAGNAIATTETSAVGSFATATMTGGLDAVGIQAIGVAVAGIVTDGVNAKRIAIYRSGNFNPAALVWDASFDTLAKQVAAFRGAPTPTNIIIRPRL